MIPNISLYMKIDTFFNDITKKKKKKSYFSKHSFSLMEYKSQNTKFIYFRSIKPIFPLSPLFHLRRRTFEKKNHLKEKKKKKKPSNFPFQFTLYHLRFAPPRRSNKKDITPSTPRRKGRKFGKKERNPHSILAEKWGKSIYDSYRKGESSINAAAQSLQSQSQLPL